MAKSATTISLLNMKGGVGKTTLAVNLAWHTFRFGKKKVLLIDLDPQFNASQYIMDYATYGDHVKKNGTVATLLIEQPALTLKQQPKRKALKDCLYRVGDGKSGAFFDFLPAQLALAHVVKNPAQMDYKLEKLLEPVRSKYDYIFIDCAPTDSVLTTMALNASNYVLVPMRPDRFSILGFGNLLETITNFRANAANPNDVRELGMVFTQVRDDSGVESKCMDDVRDQAAARNFYVFDAELGFSNTFIRAVQEQTPAFETKWARDELKDNVTDIVKEMEAQISALDAQKASSVQDEEA